MKNAASAALGLLCIVLPGLARGQIAVEADGRGVATVRVGGATYLTDLGVSVIRPGWKGDLANQRAVDPAEVEIYREGAATTYVVPLKDPLPGVLIERIIPDKEGVSLEIEVIPDQEAELEAVLLCGSLATADHAGKTAFDVVGDPSARGVLPAALDADRSVVWGGTPESIRLERPGAGGLTIVPGDARVQLQDERKRNASHFSLMLTTSGGEVLARKPIRLGVKLRAAAPGEAAQPSRVP